MAWYDGPGDRLAGNLSLVVENYRDERELHWSDDALGAALISMLDIIAHEILIGSSDLVSDEVQDEPWKPSVDRWEDLLATIEKGGLSQQLGESLEIRIAEDLVNALYEAPQRCLQLVAHILGVQPAEPVRKYLSRLGRCYIAGFLPECVILCRAVLENAVNEALRRRSASKPVLPGKMYEKLQVCRKAGWLNEQGRRDAVTIWERGNKAVHQDPELTTDVFGTIVLTMGVLGQLYDDL